MESFWVVTLGLPHDEFWKATPKRFEAYARVHRRNEDREDFRCGVVASTLVNMNRGKRGRKVEPMDFFGGRRSLDPDSLARKAELIFAAAAPKVTKEERNG